MRVALLVTCLNDAMFPEAGQAVVTLLRRLGVDLEFPSSQTCCGQPMVNTGYLDEAVPVVRTFVPVIAGVGAMPYRRFAAYNVIGAVLWAIGLPLAGYYIGEAIPSVDRYLLPIIALIILLSIAPTALHIWKENGDEITAEIRRRIASRKSEVGSRK